MLNIAIAGLGFMGATHLRAWQTISTAAVRSVVDADPARRAGDLSKAGGNLATTDAHYDFSAIRGCETLAEALTDPELDAVDICLPTDQHAAAVTAALRAGKHVLIEKPLALDSETAEMLVREAEKSGRILMAAHVLRFFPAYQTLAQAIRTSSSPIRSALFRRRCAAPGWSSWLVDSARSGGAVMDLLIHDADYCISLWGMPESVRALGYRDPGRGIDVIHAALEYSGLGPVVISGGWHPPDTFPFTMEYTVVADETTYEWSSAQSTDPPRPDPPGSDPFAAELTYFADCAAANMQPTRCPPKQSAQAVGLAERMIKSRARNGAVL